MTRRIFLGAALAAVASPALAFSLKRRPSKEKRVLSLHHLHTDEKITLTYRQGEYYQRSALEKLDQFFRDFRTGESVRLDPRLYDLLFDIKHSLDHDDAVFEIVSGYRSPKTNAMLRRKSNGVARRSLHMSGKAMDIRMGDLPSKHLRNVAVQLARGGVGYYSKSDFVHLDTGPVRRWGS